MFPAMSAARTLTTWLWSAVSALMLFVVTAHAVAPIQADHGGSRGSAFSASTAEVSLKAATRADVAAELVRLDPAIPPRLAVAVLAEPEAAQPLALRVRAQDAPLVGDPALHPLSPRAPPLA